MHCDEVTPFSPRRTAPGGQAHYSELTIGTFLMLRTAFRMPLRLTEGLMTSVLSLLMGLALM